MKNNNRHLDLSAKFIEMGQALVKEGKEKNDFRIIQSGNVLIVLSTLLFDEKDMLLFAELCSMFSAKKILEQMEHTNHDYINYIKSKGESESFDDYIQRINKLREDNGHEPIM